MRTPFTTDRHEGARLRDDLRRRFLAVAHQGLDLDSYYRNPEGLALALLHRLAIPHQDRDRPFGDVFGFTPRRVAEEIAEDLAAAHGVGCLCLRCV